MGDIFACYAVPWVSGTVTYQVTYENPPSWYRDWSVTISEWDGNP